MEAEVEQVYDLQREAGLAGLIGADGDAALAAIEESQTDYAETELPALVDELDITAGAGRLASVGGPPAPVPATRDDWTPSYSGRTAYTASMMTAILADSISSADTDRAPTTVESNKTYDTTSGDVRERTAVRTWMTLQTGQGRISGEVEMVTTTEATSASTGAPIGTLVATATGTIEVNACPNAEGVAEGNLAMEWREEFGGANGSSASSASFETPIRMLDGEDAHLIHTELELSFAKGAEGLGTPAGDWNYQGSLSVVVPRSGQVAVPAVTGNGTGATDAQAAGAAAYALTQASLIVFQVAEKAEQFWRGGKCVEVTTSEESREVDPEEEVPVTIDAKHTFDGAAVEGKAEIAFSGVEEIRPTEPIETPDDVTFVAGEDDGDEGTLEIKHTSKRGIGTKSITFTVGGGYRISLDGHMSIDSENSSEFIVPEVELLPQDDGTFVAETEAAVSGIVGFPGCTRNFTHQLPIRIVVRPEDSEPPTARLQVQPVGGVTLLRFEITCHGAMTLAPVPLDLWAQSFNTLTAPGVTVPVDEEFTVIGEAASAAGADIHTDVNLTTGDDQGSGSGAGA